MQPTFRLILYRRKADCPNKSKRIIIASFEKINCASNKKLRDENDRATQKRDFEQTCSEPRRRNSRDKCQRARNLRLCGVDYRGERHHRQRHIRHVMQERTHRAIFYFSANQSQRKNFYRQRHRACNQNVNVNVVRQSLSPSSIGNKIAGNVTLHPILSAFCRSIVVTFTNRK